MKVQRKDGTRPIENFPVGHQSDRVITPQFYRSSLAPERATWTQWTRHKLDIRQEGVLIQVEKTVALNRAVTVKDLALAKGEVALDNNQTSKILLYLLQV